MGDDGHRLARVIVEAFELATMKAERTVAPDLFAAFGLDLALVRAEVQESVGARDSAGLYDGLARRLATAAGGPEPLVRELTRRSGELLRMLNEIYDRLARTTATTAGSSESFRLQRDSVDDGLTISRAFLEQVRQTQRSLTRLEIGEVDVSGVGELVSWDDGELYGNWPLHDGVRLLDRLLHLRWVGPVLAAAADPDLRALAGTAAAVESAAGLLTTSVATVLCPGWRAAVVGKTCAVTGSPGAAALGVARPADVTPTAPGPPGASAPEQGNAAPGAVT